MYREKFDFRFFCAFEKNTHSRLLHEARFVPFDVLDDSKKVSAAFDRGILPDSATMTDWRNCLVAIKLSGDYYSTDKIAFNSVEIDGNSGINVRIDYTRAEDLDGEAFEADHFLFFRFNHSEFIIKKLSVAFRSFIADFSSGEATATESTLPYIQINFN